MAALRGPAALKLWHSGLLASGLIGAGATYQYQTDEGTRRSLYFWSRAFPIYLHYRYVQSQVKRLPEPEQDRAYQPLHEEYAPKALDIILHLRGFFSKIGQVASTRHDFLPKEYLERLSILQDDIPAEDFAYVKKVIESQAHLRGGGQEVMYPQVERLFRTDIQTIKNFLPAASPKHLTYIEEIEKQLLTEFDYEREGKNLEMIRANMLRHYGGAVVVPRPVLSTKHVLMMDFLHGERLDKALKRNLEVIAGLKGTTAAALVEEMRRKEAAGQRVDGNILLLHPHQQLGLIDCGQVKRITLEQRLALAKLLLAVASKDRQRIVQCYTDAGFRTRDMKEDVIYRHAMVIWDRDDKESLGGKNIQEYLEDLQAEDPVTYMPQDYVMAGRISVLLRGLD